MEKVQAFVESGKPEDLEGCTKEQLKQIAEKCGIKKGAGSGKEDDGQDDVRSQGSSRSNRSSRSSRNRSLERFQLELQMQQQREERQFQLEKLKLELQMKTEVEKEKTRLVVEKLKEKTRLEIEKERTRIRELELEQEKEKEKTRVRELELEQEKEKEKAQVEREKERSKQIQIEENKTLAEQRIEQSHLSRLFNKCDNFDTDPDELSLIESDLDNYEDKIQAKLDHNNKVLATQNVSAGVEHFYS
ncbi:splicing regulatory glutamine/lysine-rich protein 1-like [Procambarus clarkii]|uniref:splicing regulatory glutamine/lysine-rich protein 1-like n=1 Tax=Procambarus clarkii TaxID=6728 RepID=UPI003742BEFD